MNSIATLPIRRPFEGIDEHAALRSILEGTAAETGQGFFTALVRNLAEAMGTYGAWVTEYLPDSRRLRALAFWIGGQYIDGFEYCINGTPCEPVVDKRTIVHIPDNIIELYPGDNDLGKHNAVSYIGAPLIDVDGKVLGHLAVLDTRPLPEEPGATAVFRIFAARAAAEFQRMRAEEEIHQREEKLGRLVESALDAIVEMDEDLHITLFNPAAEKVFNCACGEAVGGDFRRYLAQESVLKLQSLIRDLNEHSMEACYSWIAGGLTACREDGGTFPAEATLSSYVVQRKRYFLLILRSVNDRLEAEQRIQRLSDEAEYLRQEIGEFHNFNEITGRSIPMLQVLRDVKQVAPADTTVLILGETGTGKELIARALHVSSRRADKPFVKVNCAALPANLIESELFGHEKGAFTGATQKREGRFALAHGGSIFLDEIGELNVDLQSKLLRVLQEGEFEPVGSSRTRKVDVRVIAATHRDLQEAVQAGHFREDLYYRLNVFPIQVPPLRERGGDIVLLAQTFVDRFARQMGRTIQPLSPGDGARLRAYSWPGNVRELENVIERAVITSRNGHLNLDRALPDIACHEPNKAIPAHGEEKQRVLTVREMEEMERMNLLRALEESGWRVAGDNGAAVRLGMKPSTLSSRMKALDLRRP